LGHSLAVVRVRGARAGGVFGVLFAVLHEDQLHGGGRELVAEYVVGGGEREHFVFCDAFAAGVYYVFA